MPNKPAIAALAAPGVCGLGEGAINQALKDTLAEFGLKMPQVAIPVRLLVCGRAQTRRSMPSWLYSSAMWWCNV